MESGNTDLRPAPERLNSGTRINVNGKGKGAQRAIVRLRGTECIAVCILFPRTALAIARLFRGIWRFIPVRAGGGKERKIPLQSRKARKGYAKEHKNSFAESLRSWRLGERLRTAPIYLQGRPLWPSGRS